MFNLDKFIAEHVTKRKESMFAADMNINHHKLESAISGRSVLVIGGAGSIGSSFIKALLPFRPSEIVIADTNENALAELTRDLRSTKNLYVPEKYFAYPVDYSSEIFAKIFRNHKGFDIAANFSAHKHVRSEKDIYSIEALITNNLFNARKFLELLCEFPPEEYFCVSTDKAANPVNIMGASKRLMEDLIFAYSDKFLVRTARFANVAFSNGSLPAGFLERIRKLQPLTAPYDVKRFFVSPEESGQICLLACILGTNRAIFFPKLEQAQMMSFDSIANALLHSYGYEVLECSSDSEALDKAQALREGSNIYPVHYEKSDTSGEKSFEEFFTQDEINLTDMKQFTSLGVITGRQIIDKRKISGLLDNLKEAFARDNISKHEIINIIKEYLPNFAHIETGRNLDNKM